MKRHTLLGVLLIITIAFLGTWFGGDTERRSEQREQAQTGPDYFMSGMTATTMDESGKARYTLHAENLLHLPEQDATELTHPRLVIHGKDKADWHVSANQGLVEKEGDLVRLRGAVRVYQRASDRTPEVELTTQTMDIYPDAQRAETTEPVVITRAGSRTDAVGMKADMMKEQLELLSQVRSYYDPATN